MVDSASRNIPDQSRTEVLKAYVTKEVKARVRRLVNRTGLTEADWLRSLIDRAISDEEDRCAHR